jgi:hypothetical protein
VHLCTFDGTRHRRKAVFPEIERPHALPFLVLEQPRSTALRCCPRDALD